MVFGRIVPSVQSNKEEIFRTRLTVDNNLIGNNIDMNTPTIDLLSVTVFDNSVISIQNTKYLVAGVKAF